jgi:hypothetical protein
MSRFILTQATASKYPAQDSANMNVGFDISFAGQVSCVDQRTNGHTAALLPNSQVLKTRKNFGRGAASPDSASVSIVGSHHAQGGLPDSGVYPMEAVQPIPCSSRKPFGLIQLCNDAP